MGHTHKTTPSHSILGTLSLWSLVTLLLKKGLFHFVSATAKERDALEEVLRRARNGKDNWLLG